MNLASVLTTARGIDARVEHVAPDAVTSLRDYSATLTLADHDATLAGWTMLTAPLVLNEFNDVEVSIAVKENGASCDLSSAVVNLVLKSRAGESDDNALLFSSDGEAPAVRVTDPVRGLAVALLPRGALSVSYSFYRVDIVRDGLTSTCLYGPIHWTPL